MLPQLELVSGQLEEVVLGLQGWSCSPSFPLLLMFLQLQLVPGQLEEVVLGLEEAPLVLGFLVPDAGLCLVPAEVLGSDHCRGVGDTPR